jgi:hypothetical protein
MRNGEVFVMGEVRGRARERVRWWLGPLLAVVGLAVLPGSVGWSLALIRSRRRRI